MSRLFVGLISGTSIDAIDAALIDASSTTPQLIATHSETINTSLKNRIAELCTAGHNEIDKLGQLDIELGQCFAQATLNLLAKANVKPAQVEAIGSHGQTIRHRPPVSRSQSNTQNDSQHGSQHSLQENGFTLQIADPNTITELTGITTVADFRRRDMACGGQGAPFAPAFHHAITPANISNYVFLNLGGIANISVIQQGKLVSGYDTGPANGLMDAWIQQHKNLPFDKNGEWAAQGSIDNTLLQQLLSDNYFSQAAPKSTGRETFNLSWLNQQLSACKTVNPTDVQATLMTLTVQSICEQIAKYKPNVVYCCGGGVHNTALMAQLKTQLQIQNSAINLTDTSELGIAPDWIEAAAFAWLAKKNIDNEAVDLTAVTGANKLCVLGVRVAGSLLASNRHNEFCQRQT